MALSRPFYVNVDIILSVRQNMPERTVFVWKDDVKLIYSLTKRIEPIKLRLSYIRISVIVIYELGTP